MPLLITPIFKSSNSKIECFDDSIVDELYSNSTWFAHKMLRSNKFQWCNRTVYGMYLIKLCVRQCISRVWHSKSTKQIWLYVHLHQLIVSAWNGLHFGTKSNANLLPFTHHSKWMVVKWSDWNKGHLTDNNLNNFPIARCRQR